MKVQKVTQTAIDTNDLDLPFKPHNTLVVANTSSGTLDLQSADDDGSGSADTWSDLVQVPANSFVEVTLDKQWIRVETDASLYLLGN